MRAGDLVVRTYGEGQRPRGFVLELSHGNSHGEWWLVRWFGQTMKEETLKGEWLEVISECR